MASEQQSTQTKAASNPATEGPVDIAEGESWYQIKWIHWNSKSVPILVQNQNGPCPLIALCNVLFLRGVVNLKSTLEIISSEALLQLLLNQMLEHTPNNLSEGETLNYQQNIQDTITILPKLQTGLDLNVKFNRVNGYEFTDTVGIFDLLQVNLYHGWIVDPENPGYCNAVGELTYNQLVEMVISDKNSQDPDKATTATAAGEFLSDSANQLTFHGLIELHRVVQEKELCVFFRNNHFSTIFCSGQKLYLLATDYGFLNESRFVWEALDSVDGDSQFFDASFKLVSTSDSQASVLKVTRSSPQAEQTVGIETPPTASTQETQAHTQDTSDKYNAELAKKLVEEAQMKEDEALAWTLMSQDASPSPAAIEPILHPQAAQPAERPAGASDDSVWEEAMRRQAQEQSHIRGQRGRSQRDEDEDDSDGKCSLL